MQPEIFTRLRQQRPLVVPIANFVTAQLVADGLNALGASPLMITAPQEATAVAHQARAIVINLGTINDEQIALIRTLLPVAVANQIPTVLDPVGVGISPYRAGMVKQLIADFKFTVIRGNASELAWLLDAQVPLHGIDTTAIPHPEQIVRQVAQQYHTTAVLTGAVDWLSDGHEVISNPFGAPQLPQLVGTGDLLASLIGAAVSVWPHPLAASETMVSAFTLAAQHTATTTTAPFAFRTALLDTLHQLTVSQVTTWATQLKGAFHA